LRHFAPPSLTAWILLFAAGTAAALDGSPAGAAEADATQVRARQLREQAKAIRAEAEAQSAVAQKRCWERFFVSACQEDAAKALRQAKARAHGLEKEAREIERERRRQEFAAREELRNEAAGGR
jgi:hypothetical protein